MNVPSKISNLVPKLLLQSLDLILSVCGGGSPLSLEHRLAGQEAVEQAFT